MMDTDPLKLSSSFQVQNNTITAIIISAITSAFGDCNISPLTPQRSVVTSQNNYPQCQDSRHDTRTTAMTSEQAQ